MLGSGLFKQVGTSHLPLPIEADGGQVVYSIVDGDAFDADGTRNSTIVDPWWVGTGRFAVAMTGNPQDWAWRADITHQCVIRGQSGPQTTSVTVRRGAASSLVFSFHPVTRTRDPLPPGIRFPPDNRFTLSLDGRDLEFTEQIPIEASASTPPGTYKALIEVSEPGQPPVLAPLNLTVVVPPPNIQIHPDQPSYTVRQDASVPVLLTVETTPAERAVRLELHLLMEPEDDIGIMRRQRSGNARTLQDLVPAPPGLSLRPSVIVAGAGKSQHTITVNADSSVPATTYRLVLRAVHEWGGSCGYEPVIADAPLQLDVTP